MIYSKVTFSVEKGFRFFENEVSFFHFFMIQFQLPKKIIKSGYYYFNLHDDNKNYLYSKKIFIDITNSRILTPDSHEDPLVENEDSYFICFQIDSDSISKFKTTCIAALSVIENDNIIEISNKNVGDLSNIYNKYSGENYSKIINETSLISSKQCILTLHLGDLHGKYSEKTFSLNSDECFDFSDYIKKYAYIGVQCSYENENPEIEEKHIIVGQKGIYLSGYFFDDNNKIMPPLLFKQEYQHQYRKNDFIKVDSLSNLILFYSTQKIKPKFFESNLLFLLPGYIKNLTYNQDGLYSTKQLHKKNHFDLDVCQNCIKNSKCIQVIPSGLSLNLFKKNITIEDSFDCDIFKLID